MFKLVLVVTVLAAAIGCMEAKMTLEEIKATFADMAKTCVDEVGATPEDIAELKTEEAPQSKGAKCMSACMFKNSGIIKDGVYDPDAIATAGKMFYDEGEPEYEKIKEIAMACAPETVDTDECEVAAKAIGCLKPKMKEAGLKPPM